MHIFERVGQNLNLAPLHPPAEELALNDDQKLHPELFEAECAVNDVSRVAHQHLLVVDLHTVGWTLLARKQVEHT